MDTHLPPMAFYGILALAVAVTARVAEKDVREAGLMQGRPWLLRLLHLPVVMAWSHVWILLLWQLFVAKISWGWTEYINVAIHTAILGLVGAVCGCTYIVQIRQGRFDSPERWNRSPKAVPSSSGDR